MSGIMRLTSTIVPTASRERADSQMIYPLPAHVIVFLGAADDILTAIS